MTLERVYHCEGPDCERHQRVCGETVFLIVHDRGHEQHFCGWDCLLRYAGTKEPEEIIPADA